MNFKENLLGLLEKGTDNAMVRYALGNEYLKEGNPEEAVPHLKRALEHDPAYSAAWKSYGKALSACGRDEDAREAYEDGLRVARDKGDMQAAREMEVFLKRLRRKAQDR